MHLQLRAYDDNRTRGIVHTLTEKVLTETSLLTLKAVGKRLERTVDVALHRARLARVVKQRIHGLLEKTLLVAQNHVGSLNLDKTLQTVVAYDHAAVKVVEVGSREAAAIERHERTELRRNHRHGLQHHPFRTVAVGRSQERIDHLQAFQSLGLALLRTVGIGAVAQFGGKGREIYILQEVVDGVGAHLGDELVGVVVLEHAVLLRHAFYYVEIFLFTQQVELLKLARRVAVLDLETVVARIDHNILLVIYHLVELLGSKTEQIAYLVGKGAEIPYMRHGNHKLDVAHALAAHLLLRNLNAATVADYALVADALVLAAMALVVLHRAEDLLAEEAVALRLVGAVVDGLRFEHFAARLLLDLFGRCKADSDFREVALYFVVSSKSHFRLSGFLFC